MTENTMTAAELISDLEAMGPQRWEVYAAYVANHYCELRLESGALLIHSDAITGREFWEQASRAAKSEGNSGIFPGNSPSTEGSAVTEIRPRLRVTGREQAKPDLKFCACTRIPSLPWAECPDCGHVHETSAECGKWLQEHSSAPVGRR
jgi:hypothetical protein